MKRIVSFLLIFAMILVLAVHAFAFGVQWDDYSNVGGAWLLNLNLDLTPFRGDWFEDVRFTYQGVEYFYIDFKYSGTRTYWMKFCDAYGAPAKNTYHCMYDGWAPNKDINTYRIIEFEQGTVVSLKFKNWLIANAIPLESGSYWESDFYLEGSYGIEDLTFVQAPSDFGLIPDMGNPYYDINLTFTDSLGRLYYGMRVWEGSIQLLRYNSDGEVFYDMWDDADGITHSRYNTLNFSYLQYVPENFYNWFFYLFTPGGVGDGPTVCDGSMCRTVDTNFDNICDRCLLPLAGSVACTGVTGHVSDLDLNGRCDNCTLPIPDTVTPSAPDGWLADYPAPPIGSSRVFESTSVHYLVFEQSGLVNFYLFMPYTDEPTQFIFSDDGDLISLEVRTVGTGDWYLGIYAYHYQLSNGCWVYLDKAHDSNFSFGYSSDFNLIYSTFGSPVSEEDGVLGWLSSIWNVIKNLPGTILQGLKSIFFPDMDEMKVEFDNLVQQVSPMAMDNNANSLGGLLNLEESEPSNITGDYQFGDILLTNVTFVDLDYLKEAVVYFRPVINGFISWLLGMYYYNQFLTFIGQVPTMVNVGKELSSRAKGNGGG